MAQDIRDLFKNEKLLGEKMPTAHQARFLKKLDDSIPIAQKKKSGWWQIAASIVVLLGVTFWGFNFLKTETSGTPEITETYVPTTKTLGDIAPGLKKVEDYYLASINLELSKIKYTPETKALFDGYLFQLSELDKEYKLLLLELTESGSSELTVNALIDNLKLRLNLLYRLRNQIKTLKTTNAHATEV